MTTVAEQLPGVAAPRQILPGEVRVAIWVLVVSILFLNQIAYMLGSFPVAVPLVLYFATVAYFAAKNLLTIKLLPAAMMAAFIAVGLVGMRGEGVLISLNSFLMTVVMYSPFVFDCKKDPRIKAIGRYFAGVFIIGCVVIAWVAIAQFALVNLLKLNALINIYFVLPAGIHEVGGYTYVRPMGGLIKANGFFLRESSLLSLDMAIAFLMEYFNRCRFSILAVLMAALFLSFSGTGVVILAAAVVVPYSRKSLRMFLLIVLAGLCIWLIGDQIPVIHAWTMRLSEFERAGSSGFARFVAPIAMLSSGLTSEFKLLFGNGPGSFDRTVQPLAILLNYQISGADLAKSLYEYGILGAVLINGLLARRLYSSDLRLELKNALFCTWLLFIVNWGEDFLLVWLLTSWRLSYGPSSPGALRRKRRRRTSADIAAVATATTD